MELSAVRFILFVIVCMEFFLFRVCIFLSWFFSPLWYNWLLNLSDTLVMDCFEVLGDNDCGLLPDPDAVLPEGVARQRPLILFTIFPDNLLEEGWSRFV